jgi:hypothetical protein
VALLYVCVLVMTLAMTWVFLSMRAVMDIGGTCASGGPYEVATPCPDNVAVLMTLGIPLMVVCAIAGSAVAIGLGAPNLLLPMWWLLFGSLGWNFLEYGLFDGDVVWGWVVCGVLFEAMAIPALLIQLPFGYAGPKRMPAQPDGGARWYVAYLLLGAVGVALGSWSFGAWS